MLSRFIKEVFKITNVFFLLLWILTPLIFSYKFKDSYTDLKSFIYILVALFLLCETFLRKSTKGKFISFAEILLVLFSLCLILSLCSAINRDEGLRVLTFWLAGVFIALFTFHSEENIVLKRIIVISSSCIILISSIYGFLQWRGIDFFKLEFSRLPVSTFGNLNFAAQYLVGILPLLLLGGGNKFEKYLSRLSFGVGVIFLLLTQSRGGFVAFLSSLIFIFILFFIKNKNSILSTTGYYTKILRKKIAVIFIGTSMILLTFNFLDCGETFRHFLSIFSSRPQNNEYRILTYLSTLKLSLNNPILGVGVGNFRFRFYEYKPQRLWELQDFFSITRQTQVHNDFLNILVESGFPSLFFFLTFVTFMLIRGVKNYFKKEGEEQRWMLGIMGGIVAILIHSIFDFPLYNPSSALCFWAFSGFLLKPIEETATSDSQNNLIKIRNPIWVIISIAIFFLSLLWLVEVGIKSLKSSYYIKAGEDSFRRGDYLKSAQDCRTGITFNPKSIDGWILLGDSLRHQKLYGKAIEAYQNAIKLDPGFLPIFNRLGFCFLQTGKNEDAKRCYENALRINSNSIPDLFNLGLTFYTEKNYNKSGEYFRRMINTSTNPDQQTILLLAESLFQSGRYDESYVYYKRVLPLFPLNKDVLERLCDISQKLNLSEEEKRGYFLRLIILDPQNKLARKIFGKFNP